MNPFASPRKVADFKGACFAAGGHWLLTSAGAKVDLTQRMRSALNSRGLRLFACDISALSAAFHFSDGSFLLPRISDHDFLSSLVHNCQKEGITAILPTRDEDLLVLSRHKEHLAGEGIWVWVSDAETVEICLDKILFHTHCLSHGLPVLPRVAMPGKGDFPFFVRKRIGSGGSAAGIVKSFELMEALYGHPSQWSDLLIQGVCHDPEYTVDALFSEDGRPVQWIARERIRVRSGESTVGRTVSIPALDVMVESLSRSLHLVGPVTVQAFWSEQSGVRLIEVNPRFGGASALGIEAGLDTPQRLVDWIQGDRVSFETPRALRYGLKMLRFSQDVFLGG